MKKIKDINMYFTYIMTRKQKKQMAFIVIMMIFVSVLETITTALILPFTSSVMGNDLSDSTMFKSFFRIDSDQGYILAMCILIIGIYFFKAAVYLFNQWYQQKFVVDFVSTLSRRVFATILKKPYTYHTHHASSEIQGYVINDIAMINLFLNSSLVVVTETMVMLFIIYILCRTDPYFTLVILGVIGISVVITNVVVKNKLKKIGVLSRAYYAEKVKWVSQTIGGLKGIVVNDKQNMYIDNFNDATIKSSKCNAKNTFLQSIPRVVVETSTMTGIFGMIAVYIICGEDISSVLPMFATFAVAAIRIMPSANRINSNFNSMLYNSSALKSVYEILTETETENLPNDNSGDDCSFEFSHQIEIKNVSFHFEDEDKNLFENVNIIIPYRKSVAFIGKTGAGKTTMADMILGLYEPQKGNIYVDGKPIDKKKWAKMVGYIPQNIYLCDDTIKANVALGETEDIIDEQKVWECLEKAQLKDFVMSLPNGLNTMTGECGIRLSGGQRQRIGIARALYGNPQFLVLDEATSSLDNETEKAIMEAIDELNGEITMLIIAHRLTTIKNCDIVYKIENGVATLVEK